jgi:hypothetical protein
MRKISLFIGVLFTSYYGMAQEKPNPSQIKKQIIATWESNEDPIFTMKIYKDSIVQYNKGEDVKDFYRYTITATPCDTTVKKRSTTGFYLNETAPDGIRICSYIDVLDSKTLTLNFNMGARLLHFKKIKR